MPELPDVLVYVESIRERIAEKTFEGLRVRNPFILRSIAPAPEELAGKRVQGVSRIGKRIVIELGDELFIVTHLMIAGRFHWKERGAKLTSKVEAAAFDFSSGTLTLTEAGAKKRASIHLVRGRHALRAFDAGGIEPLECTFDEFREALMRENHTVKRSLTDPRLFSGIGNAYSDEVLHRARLSPVKLTQKLSADEIEQLFAATRVVLQEWVERLRGEAKKKFPEKVTAFRPEMAVHGKYGKPCPVCGTAVQHIVYADNETNYCPRCQTGGKLLADRALSRLLHGDWPKSIDDIE